MLAKLPSEQALWLAFLLGGIKNKSKFKASKYGFAHVSLGHNAMNKEAKYSHLSSARILLFLPSQPGFGQVPGARDRQSKKQQAQKKRTASGAPCRGRGCPGNRANQLRPWAFRSS
ncbi:MAG: hypothetical protein ACFNZS_02670 [Ottowia sp.]|jgi:hypothetical protein